MINNDPGLVAGSLDEFFGAPPHPRAVEPPPEHENMQSPPRRHRPVDPETYSARKKAEDDPVARAERYRIRTEQARFMIANVPHDVLRSSAATREFVEAHGLQRYPNAVRQQALYLLKTRQAS